MKWNCQNSGQRFCDFNCAFAIVGRCVFLIKSGTRRCTCWNLGLPVVYVAMAFPLCLLGHDAYAYFGFPVRFNSCQPLEYSLSWNK